MVPFSSRKAFLAAAGSAAAFTLSTPRFAIAQDKLERLRIGGVFSDLFAEPFYAKPAGFFAKQGFDVEATQLSNAGAVAAAIGGGALEIGTGDLISGVNAILAGVPIELIAAGGLYIERLENQNILATAKDSPIKQPTDLKGKRIGVPTLVGLTTVCLRKWLPDHGVPVDQAQLVEMTQAATVPALNRGELAAGLLGEPFITAEKGNYGSVGYPMNAVADEAPNKQFVISVFYAGSNWIKADKARARRVVDAIYQTARWANDHHAETLQILVRDGHLDASKLAGMSRTVYATDLTPDIVQPVVTVAENEKVFKKPITAEQLIAKI